jgi:hypothetical protein
MNKGPGSKVPGLQRFFHRILRLSLDASKTLANVSIRRSCGAKFGRLLGIDSNRERPRGKHIWWTVNGPRESNTIGGKSSEGTAERLLVLEADVRCEASVFPSEFGRLFACLGLCAAILP